MDIKEYAKISKIPHKTLRWIAKKEIINTPLTENDLIGLKLLEELWGKIEIMRPQFQQIKTKDRKAFLDTCGLTSKWERWAYSRWTNQKTEEEQLPLQTMYNEIELTFNFVLSPQQKKTLFKIRRSIHNKKQYQASENRKMQASMLEYGHDEVIDNGKK
jgi:hypothetical protein